ncbi:hypothetical protein IWQ62_005156 [Dispira parvispora]|uniref:Uncharacterized protein n=1 Tax=Dispira parvispora TaxID=1520584 RepID=A0A9W8AKJ3_9FUNG|nr:hypothetical protein IWQ62_005156 [Dispira parvispora]
MQGFIFYHGQQDQVRRCLVWLLVLTVVIGRYRVYGATQLLNGGDLLPKTVPSQEFYYDDVKHYHYRGPLVKMEINGDCKVTVDQVPHLTTLDWAASAGMTADESDVGTVVFFDRLEFMGAKCQTFTDVLKQLEGVVPELTDKGYPPVKVGLFTCVLTSEFSFGGIDYEPIDDYYYHKVPGIEMAQIALDTGLMFANVTTGLVANITDDNFIPLVVQVTQERGPWNEFLFSSAFKGYLIFYYITFAPGILYAIYEFFRLMKKSKCRFQPRFFIFLAALYFLSVNVVLHPAAALSRVQNVFRFTSWMFGYPTLYFALNIWIRITRKIVKWRFLFLLIWLVYLNIFFSAVANFILVIWSVTQTSFILYFGWGIHSYVGSVGVYIMAIVMIIYGIHIIRALRKLDIFADTKAAVQRLSLLSYVAFSGGVTISTSMVLVTTSITHYVQVTLTRILLFHISSLILFISIFWILRVRESSALKRRELRVVSCSDDSEMKVASATAVPCGNQPKQEVPMRRFHIKQWFTLRRNSVGAMPLDKPSFTFQFLRRMNPWRSPQLVSESSQSLSSVGLRTLSNNKLEPSATNIPLTIPSNKLYSRGKYCPSEGTADGGLGTSQSDFSNPRNRTVETWSVDDYPNPLQYFAGATSKSEPSNKPPIRISVHK